MTLDEHLGAIYREEVIQRKRGGSLTTFKHLVQSDPHLRTAAQIRHDELQKLQDFCGGNLQQRCFISYQQLKVLKGVLNG